MASPPGTAPTLTWGALGIVYVVWGSTYLGIRYVVESVPPLLSGATRFASAAVLLAVVLVVRHGFSALRVTRREVAGAAAVGVLLLGGGNGLVVLAESPGVAVASGIAALLIATVPLLVVLLRAALGERPRPATIVGVILGLVGLALLVLPAGGVPAAPLLGGILLVVAALSWAAGSVLSGRVELPKNPFVASVWEMFAGATALACVGLARGEARGFDIGDVTASSWLGLAYLVVFGSVIAFSAYAWLLQNASVTLASTYAYVNPVVAVLLGALFVDEPITPRVVLGGAVVVAAVAVVVSTERPRPLRSGRSWRSFGRRLLGRAQPLEQAGVDRVEERRRAAAPARRRAGTAGARALTYSRSWARVSPTKNSRRSSATRPRPAWAARAAAAAAARPRSRPGTPPGTPGPSRRAG